MRPISIFLGALIALMTLGVPANGATKERVQAVLQFLGKDATVGIFQTYHRSPDGSFDLALRHKNRHYYVNYEAYDNSLTVTFLPPNLEDALDRLEQVIDFDVDGTIDIGTVKSEKLVTVPGSRIPKKDYVISRSFESGKCPTVPRPIARECGVRHGLEYQEEWQALYDRFSDDVIEIRDNSLKIKPGLNFPTAAN